MRLNFGIIRNSQCTRLLSTYNQHSTHAAPHFASYVHLKSNPNPVSVYESMRRSCQDLVPNTVYSSENSLTLLHTLTGTFDESAQVTDRQVKREVDSGE